MKFAYGAREQAGALFGGTVWDWLLFWLNELERPNIKPSTYASYRGKLENHVLPLLGDKKLSKLNEIDIQGWIGALAAKGLAASSIHTIYRVLNAALQKAVRRRCLFANPCEGAVLPSAEQEKVSALTIPQQKALEKQAFQGKHGEAVIIALYTGMRIGEISALL